MPTILNACRVKSCPKSANPETGYCTKHDHLKKDYRKHINKSYNKKRSKNHNKFYGRRWRKLQKVVLSMNPFCRCDTCVKDKLTKIATVAHHIKPVKTHPELMYNMDNLMAVNVGCHQAQETRDQARLSNV